MRLPKHSLSSLGTVLFLEVLLDLERKGMSFPSWIILFCSCPNLLLVCVFKERKKERRRSQVRRVLRAANAF